MKEYFVLQFKMTNRTIKDYGLNPIVGYCLLFVGFIGLSIYLFSKTEFAEYIYILIALSYVSKLSETKRNDFLKYCFRNLEYWKLRLTENIIFILPFIAYLFYEQLFVSITILTIISSLMALINFKSTFNYTVPTPFFGKPFEFTVGFRITFYLFFFAYFLTFKAVYANNFNLGVFSLLLVFIVSIFFYTKPENEYYVWSFVNTSKGFLIEKIKTGLIYSTFLSIPILIALGIFFFNDVKTLLVFQLLGYVYLITIILAKYSAYPNKMNLPQGILIGISLFFPPILIGVIPFLYIQSVNRLNDFLE